MLRRPVELAAVTGEVGIVYFLFLGNFRCLRSESLSSITANLAACNSCVQPGRRHWQHLLGSLVSSHNRSHQLSYRTALRAGNPGAGH